MKIIKVETILISEKLQEPWVMGLGTATKRDELIVRIHTDEGISGIGSSYHGHTPHPIRSLIDTKLGPLLVGQNPLQIQTLWEKMFFGSIHLGSAAIQAIAGLDIALWDIMGKVTNQPIYKLLGGGDGSSDRGPLLASYVGCQTLGIKDLDTLVAEARSYVGQGFKAIKLRGGGGVNIDIAAVEATRAAVGSNIDIMIDVNARYSWSESVRLNRELMRFNTFWMEDPFDFTVAYHREEIGKLRGMGLTPIASGGNVFTRFDFKDLAQKGGVDYLTPDVVKSGGISEAIKIAAIASAYNIVIATHTYNGLTQIANLHFAAAIPAHIRGHVEWDPGKYNVFRDKLVKPAVKVKDGILEVPNGPGLGVELNEGILDELSFIEGPEILGVPRKRTWAAGT